VGCGVPVGENGETAVGAASPKMGRVDGGSSGWLLVLGVGVIQGSRRPAPRGMKALGARRRATLGSPALMAAPALEGN
jgi:hypothetical protein